MPTGDGSLTNTIGILLVFVLVAANGFFVAAEFSLVAVRRSRVAQLVAAGRRNAQALQRAVDNLDAYLAATQLGITISSLALGWIGEPALARLIEPFLSGLLGSFAAVGAHAIAVAVAFFIITALHIVLGELAPKSLAPAQRRQRFVVRHWHVLIPAPAGDRHAERPGNLITRLYGLRPGTAEDPHSRKARLLIAAVTRWLRRRQEVVSGFSTLVIAASTTS
jgi:hypothetical protein